MEAFHFLRPLWLLALLPALLLSIYWWRHRIEQDPWKGLVDQHLLKHLRHKLGTRAHRQLPLLLLSGWLVATLALAGPSWQKIKMPNYRSNVAPLVMVLDLSRSMDSEDLKPSRLAVARLKLQSLLYGLSPRQIGLVVYAASAHTVLPLTEDHRIVDEMLFTLETELMPAQGSRSGEALLHAFDLLRRTGEKRGELLLITDGPDGLSEKVVQQLQGSGIKVSVYGMATETGAKIPVNEGVLSRANFSAMKRLADMGGGMFVSVRRDNHDVRRLLERFNQQVEDMTVAGDGQGEIWRDEGSSLLLLLLPLALMAFRSGWIAVLFIFMLVPIPPAHAFEWDELWWTADQRAMRAMKAGDMGRAAVLFTDPMWKGVAYYRLGDFQAAEKSFARINTAMAHFNRANALVRLGRLEEALAAYEQSLVINPSDKQAVYNRTLLLGMMTASELRPDTFIQQAEKPDENKSPQSDDNGRREDYQELGSDRLKEPSPEKDDRQDHDVRSRLAGGAIIVEDTQSDVQSEVEGKGEGQSAGGGETLTESREGYTADPSGGEHGDREEKDEGPRFSRGQSQKEQIAAEQDKTENRGRHEQEADDDESRRDFPFAMPRESELEYEQALGQWLNRIPDRPGAYLKRKFALELKRRPAMPEVDQPW